jgi:4-hydroxyphenylacetate 3-monooxygenase
MAVEQQASSLSELGLRLPEGLGKSSYLMTGDEYRSSLRDGRRIIDAGGLEVPDVTTHPNLRGGIDHNAAAYDAQWTDEGAKTTVHQRDDGRAASSAWLLPRTVDDLRHKRAFIRWNTYRTLGMFGRPFDYGYGTAAGLLAVSDRIAAHSPEWSDNVARFVDTGARTNLMTFGLGADVQSDRSIPLAQKPGRLRCVEERPDGLVLYGAKPCGSAAAQAHVGILNTLVSPGVNPDSMVYCAVPSNSEGLTLVLRPPVAKQGNTEDSPVDARIGEESDALLIFNRVFIPRDLVFNYKNPELLESYYEVQGLTLWHVLVRLAYRAQIFAATAQMMVTYLGTDKIPQVRDAVSDITAYAEGLMAYVVASEEQAVEIGGLLIPNERYVTPGRLYSVVELPRIMQLLRELSGQGMITRMTTEQWSRADLGPLLDEFLPGTGVTAREKNYFFNFLWDMTCSENAMRVALFENVNSLPPAGMRARIFQSQERDSWMRDVMNEFRLPTATQGV